MSSSKRQTEIETELLDEKCRNQLSNRVVSS